MAFTSSLTRNGTTGRRWPGAFGLFRAWVLFIDGSKFRTADADALVTKGPVRARDTCRSGQNCRMRPVDAIQKIGCTGSRLRDILHWWQRRKGFAAAYQGCELYFSTAN